MGKGHVSIWNVLFLDMEKDFALVPPKLSNLPENTEAILTVT